ncbi:MAG TPA: folylpolyglutamate synthase/dihydrofolate synthase family protein [Aliidongia sp.]|nr:folylpolyglutamate synthase/dihydrofolate synthase family protein [Aliidongia sp.]
MSRSDAILDRLTRLHPKAIDLSLGRILRLLRQLGDPHERLPPVVHVAGTNGKGSTIATLRACLEAANYRVHAFTSPHLVHFNERIRLAGHLIEEPALVALLEEVERVNAGEPITFFEITSAAAYLAFARAPADIVLLETGLGGRYDTTNLIAAPAAAAITPVSMDHMHYLGDTIAKIAGEKAGILKAGRPGVIGPQLPEAEAVIEAQAAELAAPLYRFGREWRAEPTGNGWRFEGESWRWDLPLSRLPGRHQIDNAGVALAVLERLDGFALTREQVAAGLASVEWPARLQHLTRGPLVEALPPGWELWLDGGHNRAGGEALAEHAKGWRDRPLYAVFGTLNTRSPADILEPLAPLLAGLQGVAIPGEANTNSAETVAEAGRALGIPSAPAASVDAAVAAIADGATGPARILVCGSLYLAGHVLAENG